MSRVIVALGGSGERLGEALTSLCRSAGTPVQLLCVDARDHDAPYSRPDGRFFGLGGVDLHDAARLVRPGVAPWIDLDIIDRNIPHSDAAHGAYAAFEVGLVLAEYNRPRLSVWLRSQIADLKSELSDPEARVVVVGSLAGGTGSALFPSVLEMITDALRFTRIDCPLFGFVLSAGYFSFGTWADHFQRNAKLANSYLATGYPWREAVVAQWKELVVSDPDSPKPFDDDAIHDLATVVHDAWLSPSTPVSIASSATFKRLSDFTPVMAPTSRQAFARAGPRIFISYAREDAAAALDLYNRLADAGFQPWIDKCELTPGDDWNRSIRHAIRSSDFVLVCLSRTSLGKRGYVQAEIRYALECYNELPLDRAYLIPARLEECQPPEELRKYQYADLFAADGFHRLSESLMSKWVAQL